MPRWISAALVLSCALLSLGADAPAVEPAQPQDLVVEPVEAPPTVDRAWQQLLAAEDIEAADPAEVQGVNPMTRAQWLAGLSLLALLGLLALPGTRRALLTRLATSQAGDGVQLLSQRQVAGVRLAVVEVEGSRLLLGIHGRGVEMLHVWGEGVPAMVTAPVLIEEPAEQEAQAASEAPATTVAPPPQQLVQQWRRAVCEVDRPPVEEPAPPPPPTIVEQVIARARARREQMDAIDAAALEPPAPLNLRPRAARSEERRAAARLVLLMFVATALVLALPDLAWAQGPADGGLSIQLGGEGVPGANPALKLLVSLTLVAVAPALILAMTSFTRIIVIFSLLRQAMGVQQTPPNQVLIGLSLFLTWFVMAPVFEQVNERSVQPYLAGQITEGVAVEQGYAPLRTFMLQQTRHKDLALFLRMDRAPAPQTRADVPARVLVPAFLISELRTAFQVGFLLYIPFLVVDLVVSTVLLAMGMMVLPPIVISMPFKLLLFVFVDGWNLIVGSVVRGFGIA